MKFIETPEEDDLTGLVGKSTSAESKAFAGLTFDLQGRGLLVLLATMGGRTSSLEN